MPKKTESHAERNMIDEDIQKKYMQLQMIKQHLSALLEEKRAIDEKTSELSITVQALQKLPDVKKNEEIWSTLGSGTFVRSDIKDTDNVFIAVGAGIVVKETAANGIKILSGRLDQLARFEREIAGEINKFGQHAQKLENELEHEVQSR